MEFYEKLAYAVQSLETLKKLDAVNGTVAMTLEVTKYSGDLVRIDTTWESGCTYDLQRPSDFGHVAIQLKLSLMIQARERRNQYQLQTQQENPSKNEFVYFAMQRAIDCPNAILS